MNRREFIQMLAVAAGTTALPAAAIVAGAPTKEIFPALNKPVSVPTTTAERSTGACLFTGDKEMGIWGEIGWVDELQMIQEPPDFTEIMTHALVHDRMFMPGPVPSPEIEITIPFPKQGYGRQLSDLGGNHPQDFMILFSGDRASALPGGPQSLEFTGWVTTYEAGFSVDQPGVELKLRIRTNGDTIWS